MSLLISKQLSGTPTPCQSSFHVQDCALIGPVFMDEGHCFIVPHQIFMKTESTRRNENGKGVRTFHVMSSHEGHWVSLDDLPVRAR